jgi:hypothetical protein
VLCCAVLCCAVLCCAVCGSVLCCAVCCAVLVLCTVSMRVYIRVCDSCARAFSLPCARRSTLILFARRVVSSGLDSVVNVWDVQTQKVSTTGASLRFLQFVTLVRTSAPSPPLSLSQPPSPIHHSGGVLSSLFRPPPQPSPYKLSTLRLFYLTRWSGPPTRASHPRQGGACAGSCSTALGFRWLVVFLVFLEAIRCPLWWLI